MAQHPVRSGDHRGHLHGCAGNGLRLVSARQQREPHRTGIPAGVPRGSSLHEGPVQRRRLPVAQRGVRLVLGAGQRFQLHRVVQTGALDQGRPHVRDQRPGGEMQREELRTVPAGGGAAGLQVRHAGPHADPAGGGDRGGDPGSGEPADRRQ